MIRIRKQLAGWKGRERILSGPFWSALALSVVINGAAEANPSGARVVNGQATIKQNGKVLTVRNSPGTIIEWNAFSIQKDEATRFIQQHSRSAVLNRVTGRLPSDILGDLTSNGRVFVINPNGVVVGKDARIDTAGFVASTLNLSNEDFLADRLNFQGSAGAVRNRGTIRAASGGSVVLIAPDVENTGLIHAPDGHILLAAGREITLASLDHPEIRYRVAAPGDTVLNLGTLLAENGSVRVFADQINAGGEISATRVREDADGSIVLEAESEVEVSGSLDTRGKGVAGGSVNVLGERVALRGATVDASGSRGGGTVLIGGDFQGKGATRTAATTGVDAGTTIRADAVQKGDGGKVIVWSDTTTRSMGKITARGGANGGDGGLVETSGKENLAFEQAVDVSAPQGKPGTWLVDPEDITIGSSEAEAISTSLNGGSNVSIQTSETGSGEGNIQVNAPIRKTEGPDASLSLNAHNRIDVNAPITSTEGKLDVRLRAGRDVAVNAEVRTNGGSFSAEITGVVPEPAQEEETTAESADSDAETPAGATAQTQADNEQTDPSAAADSQTPEVPEVPVETPVEVAEVAPSTEPPVGAASDAAVAPPASVPEPAPTDSPSAAAPDAVPPRVQLAATPGSRPITRAPSRTAEAAPTASEEALFVDESRGQIVIRGEIDTDGGDIKLNAEEGDVVVSGKLDSSSDTSRGGNITLEGDRIALVDEAVVDASGEGGGGEVLIGGGQQGDDPSVRNASFTHVGENAAVHSDGGQHGDGGRVIVYADNTANVQGTLTARGGVQSGDGGFVETSGRRSMVVMNAADVSAANGEAGEWLIDPISIRIVDDYQDTNILTGDSPWQPIGAGATLNVDTIKAGLDFGASVTITTSEAIVPSVAASPDSASDPGDINWEADLDLDGMDAPGQGSLTLRAHNDINMTGSIYDSDVYTDDGLAGLTLVADQDNDGSGDVNILGDSETGVQILDVEDFSASGNHITVKNAYVSVNNIDLAAAGDVQLGGGSQGVSLNARNAVNVEGRNINIGSDDTGGAWVYGNEVDLNATENMRITSGSGYTTVSANTTRIDVGGKLTLEGEQSRVNGYEEVTIDTVDFDWTGGEIVADRTGVLTTTGETTIRGADNKYLGNTVWNQAGNADWSGGDVYLNDSTIRNSGHFEITGDNVMATYTNQNEFSSDAGGDTTRIPFITPIIDDNTGGFGNFYNTGTLQKTGGGGASRFDRGVFVTNEGQVNAASGNIEFAETYVQEGGETDLVGGDITVEEGFDLARGRLVGDGTITGDVYADDATIAPGHSPGTLTIDGNFSATDNTQFEFEIAGTASGDFDVLEVTGTADLAGSMQVAFIDGYAPVLGEDQDSFDLITGGTTSGSVGLTHTSSVPDGVNVIDTQDSGGVNVTYRRDNPVVEPPEDEVPDDEVPDEELPPTEEEPPAAEETSPGGGGSGVPDNDPPITVAGLPGSSGPGISTPPDNIDEVLVVLAQPRMPEEELQGETVRHTREASVAAAAPAVQMCTASFKP